MGATLTTFDSLFKDHYIGPIEEQLQTECIALEMMEKATVTWKGRKCVLPVHVGRNTGTGYTGGGLPVAGQQTYRDLEVTAKKVYGTFKLDGDVLAAAEEGGEDAFAGVQETELKGLTADLKNLMNRLVFSGGQVKAFIHQSKNEAGAAVWEASGDVAALADAIVVLAGPVNIQVVRLDTYAVVQNNTVTAANATTMNITLSAALNTTVVDAGIACAIKIANADAATLDIDKQPIGFYGKLCEPTHFTVDRTDLTGGDGNVLQSTVFTGVDTGNQNRVALSLAMFDRAIDEVEELHEDIPDVCFIHHKQRQRYVALQQGTIQTNQAGGSKVSSVNMGTTGASLAWGDIPIKPNRHCGKGLMIFLNKETWKRAELKKLAVQQKDGSILSRVSGQDQWEGFVAGYHNYVCVVPNANAIVVGFTV
jgi:hypothetical protein